VYLRPSVVHIEMLFSPTPFSHSPAPAIVPVFALPPPTQPHTLRPDALQCGRRPRALNGHGGAPPKPLKQLAFLTQPPSRHRSLYTPSAPPLSHRDRQAARPPQPNIVTDGARVVCDAGGDLIYRISRTFRLN